MFTVEYIKGNEWVSFSMHMNQEHAIATAEVISRSRKCHVRVLSEGKIVESIGEEENR
jgi:hypothetical protein